MTKLRDFSETVFGCVAVLLASIMTLGACYAANVELGNVSFVLLCCVLAICAVFFTRRSSGLIRSSLFAAGLTLVFTGLLAGFAKKIVTFSVNAEMPESSGFSQTGMLLFVILPVCLLAAILAIIVRRLSLAKKSSGSI